MSRRLRLAFIVSWAAIVLMALPAFAQEDFFPGWRSRSWPQSSQAQELNGWRLVVDPGHGGSETGACPETPVCEKEFNLAISLKLRAMLEARGAQVVMTRTGDTTVSLDERIAISNSSGAHRFLSVHINSATNTSARGIETWVDADGVDPNKMPTTAQVWQDYAQTIHTNLMSGARSIDAAIPDRGLKFSGITPPWNGSRIRVIRSDLNRRPSALVEVGFMSNATDFALLLRDDYQYAVAQGLAQAFIEHASVYKPQDGVLN